MSLIFSSSMFFLSFIPLWISVLFIEIMSLLRETDNVWTEWIAIISIGIVLVFSIMIFMYSLNRKNTDTNQEYILLSAKEDKTISVEFLLSYILPLFAFDFTKWEEVVLFLIFFLTLGWLTIKHNRFTVNFVLDLLRYRVYDCVIQTSDSKEIETKIISKNILIAQVGSEIILYPLNNDYKMDYTIKSESVV